MGNDEASCSRVAQDDNDDFPIRASEQLSKLEAPSIVDQNDYEIINFGSPEHPKELKIGKSLSPADRAKIIEFLRPRLVNFAFSYQEMPRLDENLIIHQMPLKSGAKPIKQKLRD